MHISTLVTEVETGKGGVVLRPTTDTTVAKLRSRGHGPPDSTGRVALSLHSRHADGDEQQLYGVERILRFTWPMLTWTLALSLASIKRLVAELGAHKTGTLRCQACE